jgi:DNA-directed RNA polymerase subunit RPC12/RpoP
MHAMIDTVLNLLFRCSHRRLTRPVTPVSIAGLPHGETYVVCLDCGKQFAYDMKQMRIGKPLPSSHPTGVLKPQPAPAGRTLKYAIWAGVPLAFLVGVALKGKKSPPAAGVPPAAATPPGADPREEPKK